MTMLNTKKIFVTIGPGDGFVVMNRFTGEYIFKDRYEWLLTSLPSKATLFNDITMAELAVEIICNEYVMSKTDFIYL